MANISAELGLKGFLSKFDDSDLNSLVSTVTKGLLKNKISSRNDAIEAIIKFSDSEESILRRKIVKRELMFMYLQEKHVKTSLTCTKNDLILKMLNYWNLQPNKIQDECPEVKETNLSIYQEEEDSEEQHKLNSGSVSLLAQQFSCWFYTALNSKEPFPQEHFFSDAKIKINLHSNGQTQSHFVEQNPEEIANLLYSIKTEHNLFFNPNSSKEGVQGRMDPHGLVLVLVCGTLHQGDSCAGVFEQVFGLARDPFSENNWKIKHSEMNLRSQNKVLGPPALEDAPLMVNLLALPDSN